MFGDAARAPGDARRRAALGVLGAVLALLVLSGLRAIATPPFSPPDETAHVAYAFALLEWEIPHIATFPDDLPVPGMVEGLSTWTANHPPGPYALMALPLWAGEAAGQPLAGFWAARLLNVLGAAIAVVLSARIAATIMPTRPRAVVGTAAIAALVPYFGQIAGTAYTDGLALAPTVALLAVAVDVLVRGPSRGRLIWLVALSAMAAIVRAPAVVLVLLAGIAWGVSQLLHRRDRLRARLRRAVGGAALLGLGAFAAAGWFYLGNLAIYGDPTGSEALFELHSRDPRGGYWARLTAAGTYTFQELQLWSKVEGLPADRAYVIPGVHLVWLHRVVLAGLSLGVASGVWHVARTRLRGQGPTVAAWVLLAVWWWALLAMMVQFVTGGGAPHARYLWPAFTGPAMLLAVGLDVLRLPLPRRLGTIGGSLPVGLWTGVGALVWANLYGWPRALSRWQLVGGDDDLVQSVVGVMAERQVPGPGWAALAACAALVGALVLLAWALAATPSVLIAGAPDGGAPADGGVAGTRSAGGDPAPPAEPAEDEEQAEAADEDRVPG